MKLYFDKTGKPLEVQEWAELFEREDYKRIGHDVIDPFEVSTIWVGLRLGITALPLGVDEPPPLIFETAVFDSEGVHSIVRYATEEQARAGHEAVCAEVRASGLDVDGE